MALTSTKSPWLARSDLNDRASLRLFCFPYAGGNATVFRGWSRHLPQFVNVCPVELPGRAGRFEEEAFTDLLLLAQVLAGALRPYLDMPFAFFGHSMGALISFELSRELLRNYGMEPAHLFVSGCRAPHLIAAQPVTYNLPDDEFIQELRRLKGIPAELLDNPEFMQFIIPLLRADFRSCQTCVYSHGVGVGCPITAFGGLQDELSQEDIESWREHTNSSFALRMLPGDHFFLHSSTSLLLSILSQQLDQLKGRTV